MLSVFSALVSTFFDVMDFNSFFGHSFLVVTVVSFTGLLVTALRRLIAR